MVAPVPAQISKLRHCPTPRSLRIYPLPPLTAHFPLVTPHLLHVASISLPFSAASAYFLSPQRCTPRQTYGSSGTPTLLLPITSLQPQQLHAITHSFAQRRAAIPPILNSFHTLSVATGVVPLLPPCSGLRILCVALFPAVARSVFSATCSLFFSLCSLFANPTLCFQSLADSFSKTPGVGVGSQSRHLESTTSRLFFPKVGSSRCAPCLCSQSSSFQNQPTACIVETRSGMSMRITVPSPVRLSISRRKSVPYSTRSRSRTLLRPMPSTYTCGTFSSEMPTPVSSISMCSRPS